MLMLPLLLMACFNEVPAPETGQGSFTIGLATDTLGVEIDTRAPRQLTDVEASDFLVTLTDADGTVWQYKRFADITAADRTQPLGEGYVVTAENITATAAESNNGGWGERRFAGSSEPFAVVGGQTTHVTVPCSMANTGLCVSFDEAFTDYFTDFAVTTDDSRALKFSDDNAAPAQANTPADFPATTAVAYYNVDPATATVTVPLIISASAGWDGTVRLTRTLTLRKGRLTRLAVRLNSTEPTTGNISVLAITYDDTFTEGATTQIVLE